MTIKPITGDPCWTDLSTSNLEGAKDFYTQLFGWTYTETREDMAGYTQALKDGKPVAGLFHLMPEMTTSVWSLYFCSDDVTKTQALITENSGTVISPPMAVENLGSMMVASDPTGAVFGVWQPETFAGAQRFNDPGSLTWEDLRSKDPARSREFFTAVFGFRHDELPMDIGDADYRTFAHASSDRPLGGMGDMMGAPDSVPSHWLVYFRVEDTPAAIDVVRSAGGAVIAPEMQTPFGRQAVVSDPWGGTFCIIDSKGTKQPS